MIGVKNEIKNICTIVEDKKEVGESMWVLVLVLVLLLVLSRTNPRCVNKITNTQDN